jgi:hypothetical protein
MFFVKTGSTCSKNGKNSLLQDCGHIFGSDVKLLTMKISLIFLNNQTDLPLESWDGQQNTIESETEGLVVEVMIP